MWSNLLYYNICNKCGSENEKILKENQSVKRSKTFGLINMYKHKMKIKTPKSRILIEKYIYKKIKIKFIK